METVLNIQEEILGRFKNFVTNGRMGHAYLFVGPIGIGKKDTALAIAKLLNCENNKRGSIFSSCEECSSCQKIISGNHPDIHVIDNPPGESLKIEQIRELILNVQLMPFEAKWKVYIICNVENMTQEAANALLKTLEEPTINTLIILTTNVLEKNLATIRSRCHIMYFSSWSEEKLEGYLKNIYHLEEEAIQFLSHFAQRVPIKVKALYDSGLLKRKNEIINQFILNPDSDSYVKSISLDKEKTKEFLDVLLYFFRDVLLLKSNVDKKRLANADRLKDLEKLASHYTWDELSEIINEVVQAMKSLEDNLNTKVAMSLIKEMIR